MGEFLQLLKERFCAALPLADFNGREIVYRRDVPRARVGALRALMRQRGQERFGLKAMEEEISASLTIENIDFSRESVRKILRGGQPRDESEDRVLGMKRGLEFIGDIRNLITEDNILRLYQMAVGSFQEGENRLLPGRYYRHDQVYVMGRDVEHTGLAPQKLPAYMERFLAFIQAEDDGMDELLKAAVIHFYFSYLHPYFDGNGRMARLLHLWYLVQRGYPSALFIPFSSYIEGSRREYYNAYTMVEKNAGISGFLDVTPFLNYFVQRVYGRLSEAGTPEKTARELMELPETVTEKEEALWRFVLSNYGGEEFSTKELERDFHNAAYATIRKFVLKFKALGLLSDRRMGSRVKYRAALE